MHSGDGLALRRASETAGGMQQLGAVLKGGQVSVEGVSGDSERTVDGRAGLASCEGDAGGVDAVGSHDGRSAADAAAAAGAGGGEAVEGAFAGEVG